MITVWRIVSANYKDKAYTGDGARIHGGRWNSKGVAVVYTADRNTIKEDDTYGY